MSNKHTISQSDDIFRGSAYVPTREEGRRGVPFGKPIQVFNLGAPDTADADGIATGQTTSGAADLTLDGTYASNGTATLDVPRTVSITSGSDESGLTFTVTGTDEYGYDLSEDITGPNATTVNGAKAFKTVTNIAVDGAITASDLTAGTADIFGLPYALNDVADLSAFFADGTEERSSATLQAADTTDPATASSGDVRGTVAPDTAADGSVEYRVHMAVQGTSTRDALGIKQNLQS
jgi:hypothetical protein